jgi:plastocyanin
VPRPLAAIAATIALLAGCGGEDEEPEGRAVTTGGDGTLAVAGDEYSFDPANVVVKGSDGSPATVRISLRNEGALAHNLRVRQGGRELGGTATFQGDETRSAKLTLPRGRYELVCTVGNHAELGMRGRLEVR